ncbi:unnamed protein product, partial [marine sediment metagenome]
TGLSFPGFGFSCQFMDYDSIGFGGPGYRYNEVPTPIESGISVNRGIDEIGYGVSLFASPFDFMSIEIDNNKISTHDSTLNTFEEIITLNKDMA